MSSENGENPGPYPVEPDEEAPSASDGSLQRRHSPEVERSGDVEPLPLEPQAPPGEQITPAAGPSASAEAPASSVKALDVCPNCGASMRGRDALVCLRCGFDLKTLAVIETVTGEITDVEQEEEEPPAPLGASGRGGMWLPATMAGASAVALAIGYLTGADGLFAGDEPPLGERFSGLFRGLALIGIWALCGLGALSFLARFVLSTRVGDARLAIVRMLGIAATMRLIALMAIPVRSLEWTVESLAQAACFVGLATFFFQLKVRDAFTMGAATVALWLILLLLSLGIMWAAQPGG